MSKDFETIFKEFADSDTFVMSRGLLEDYKRQAAQAERERIIKLLEDPSVFGMWDDHALGLVFRQNFIALIKGGNK